MLPAAAAAGRAAAGPLQRAADDALRERREEPDADDAAAQGQQPQHPVRGLSRLQGGQGGGLL